MNSTVCFFVNFMFFVVIFFDAYLTASSSTSKTSIPRISGGLL